MALRGGPWAKVVLAVVLVTVMVVPSQGHAGNFGSKPGVNRADSILSLAHNAKSVSIPTSGSPIGIAYDSWDGDIYTLTDEGAIQVISPATNTIIKTVDLELEYISGSMRANTLTFGNQSGWAYPLGYQSGTAAILDTNLTLGEGYSWVNTLNGSADPDNVVYDPANGLVYANDLAHSVVYAMQQGWQGSFKYIGTGSPVYSLGYDPSLSEMFGTVSDGIVAINDTSLGVVLKASLGTDGQGEDTGIVYAPSSGLLYVSGTASSLSDYSYNLTEVNPSTGSVIGHAVVGETPGSLVYDPLGRSVLSMNWGSSNVSVLNTSTNSVTLTIPVGTQPDSAAFDPLTGEVFVANFYSKNVTVIDPTPPLPLTATVSAAPSSGPAPLKTWLNATGAGGVPPYTFAWHYGDGTKGSSAAAQHTYAANGTYAAVVWVNDSAGHSVVKWLNVTVGGGGMPKYSVSFLESGLPTGTNWSVVLSGSTLSSATRNITFSEPNGTYPFTVGSVLGYTANKTSGSVKVNGSSVTLPITFTKNSTTQRTYLQTFTESGLPGGTRWSVTMNGTTNSSTTTTIGFSVPNGSYSYTVGVVPGFLTAYPSGLLVVNGFSGAVSIDYTANPRGTYSVIFQETGMPSGKIWSVGLNQSQNSSQVNYIIFTQRNGTYLYLVAPPSGYNATPFAGTVTVSGRAVYVNVTISASSTTTTYAVKFAETGLSSGTNWTVTLAGKASSSTGSTISFSEMNGTYNYTVTGPTGSVASPSSGSLTVAGKEVYQSVTFTTPPLNITYPVTFSESGLVASGLPWSVTLNSTTKSNTTARSGTGSITFMEPNGTYLFSVGAIAGYSVSPSPGSVKVSGNAVSQSVTFTALPVGQYSVIFSETDLPTGTNWSVTLAGKSSSSTGSTISFAEENGTYNFTVAGLTGYAASPTSGSLTVAGQSIDQAVTFSKSSSKAAYTVAFTESGLPPEISWWVTLNGKTPSSVNATITFQEANGSYSYSVGVVTGYTASPSSGILNVSGKAVSQTITFTVSPPSKGKTNQTTTFLGLPGEDGYILIGVVVAAVVILVTVVLIRKRKEKEHLSPSPPPAGSPPTP